MPNSVFLSFRLSLPARDREVLDALALKLVAVSAASGGAVRPDGWWRCIQRALPGASAKDCQALASYAVEAAASGVLKLNRGPAEPKQGLDDLQHLQDPRGMQNSNRTYTAVLNIMKTKHETVKNTISNIH